MSKLTAFHLRKNIYRISDFFEHIDWTHEWKFE